MEYIVAYLGVIYGVNVTIPVPWMVCTQESFEVLSMDMDVGNGDRLKFLGGGWQISSRSMVMWIGYIFLPTSDRLSQKCCNFLEAKCRITTGSKNYGLTTFKAQQQFATRYEVFFARGIALPCSALVHGW